MPSDSLHKVSVCKAYSALKVPRGSIQKLYHILDKGPAPHAPAGELSVALLTGEAIADLHARFLNDATPTDVITFDGDSHADFAGEICVSVDQALSQCAHYDSDFATELTLYLVHGWLHLAGYDDHAPDDIAAMRAAEQRALALLRAHGAIPAFSIDRV